MQSAAGSVKIMLLQCLIISCLPAIVVVVVVVRGGAGADNDDICLGDKTSCRVGRTAVARTKVSCFSEMRPAMSASPLAALP